MLMVPRFLEVGVHAPDIRESLAFYESLGFTQARTGEAWPYPYAVVTDGRAAIGLHQAPIASPRVTFVCPQLARMIEHLEQRGCQFEERQLGEDVFNSATLTDPNGLALALLEARTFSPPSIEPQAESACGYFAELGVPARDVDGAAQFWEMLGFVRMDEQSSPFVRTALTSDRLNLALYRSRAFRAPLLTFENLHMRERLSSLRERGFTLSDEMPDGLDEAENAVLIAPEGTRLLLLNVTD